MDVQLLLNLQKVCNSKGIKLPWDEAAALVGPTITGNAATQHLAKLYKKRVLKNLPVPEPLTRGGGFGIEPRGATDKAKDTQKILTSNEEDDEEDFDVDKATDSDASFGEERKKRTKRAAKSTTDVSNNEKSAKGDIFSVEKLKKNSKGKGKKHASGDTKRKGMKTENSTSPNLAAAERAAECNTLRKAKDYVHDPDETVTESEAEYPGFAVGSSILELVGVQNEVEEETIGDHGGIQDKGAIEDGNHKVTVLKLGQSKRSLECLRQVGSSQITDRSISGPTSGSSSAGAYQDASMGLGFNGDMAENSFNPQYYGQHTALGNFGSETNGPFFGGRNVGNFSNFPAFPYSTATNTLMPPTPMSSIPFGGFPSDPFGSDVGLGERVAYSAAYASGANVPAFLAPHTPGSSHESTGLFGATFGGHGDSGQTSYDSSSGNLIGMGDINFGGIDFDNIDTSGVGHIDHTPYAPVGSNDGVAQDHATSGTAYGWTTQPSPALPMPDEEDLLQFLSSGFNGNMGEPEDLNGIFGEFETGSGGSVGPHGYV
jgi:hypothetical protein